MNDSPFTAADREQLRERGISEAEALRQLALLGRPTAWADVVRPCTVGDGIERVDEATASGLLEREAAASGRGRRVKFVPASGAATRMFRDLLRCLDDEAGTRSWDEVRRKAARGRAGSRAAVRLREGLDRFPFRAALERALGRNPAEAGPRELLTALLTGQGLAYAELPKGLLAFHDYGGSARTAFEEHLVEGAGYARDGAGTARLHFTISDEHRPGFRDLLQRVGAGYEREHGVRFEVDFSAQHPETDTLASDLDGRPFRDADGRLLFRPGGHGALINNLDAIDADLVFVKNIDNVQPDRVKPLVVRWKRVLAGRLLDLQGEVFERVGALRDGTPSGSELEAALDFVRRRLHVEPGPDAVPEDPPGRRDWLLDRLERPLRVCGVVPNTGEPGGGPFWVRGGDGTVSPQIVETSQIDQESQQQRRLLRAATHFNPVDLVCAPRGVDGEKYDLARFVDEDAVIVTVKSAGGRELKALERPGLWNGAMAGWNTAFVEVPLETFSPVKTVLDLLRDEHQPG